MVEAVTDNMEERGFLAKKDDVSGRKKDQKESDVEGNISENYKSSEKPLSDRIDKHGNRSMFIKSITNIWFTGKVFLKGCDVILKTESMTRPFKVCTKRLEAEEERMICDVSEHKIGEISAPFPFSLKINDLYGYSINLNYKMCIEPLECDILTFNDMFNKIDECVFLQKSFVLNESVYVLDRSSFSFKMLNELFFGRVMRDGIVLKSNNKNLLDIIAKEFK